MASAPATLVQLALKELGADPPTTQSIIRLAATLAQAVNRWPGLKGPQKLETVLAVLREVLEMEVIRGKLKPEERTVLRVMVDTVVPETVTLLVAAGRGEFDLRKPTPGCLATVCAALCRTGAAVATAVAPQDGGAQQAAGILQGAASAIGSLVPASEKEAPTPAGVTAPEAVELTPLPSPAPAPATPV